jgi:hypothetical protein
MGCVDGHGRRRLGGGWPCALGVWVVLCGWLVDELVPRQFRSSDRGCVIVGRVVDERHDDWTVFHFGQSNPAGPGQGSVPALLRRVADSIDELGDVVIQDITFHSEVTGDEDDLTMTVYYARP